MSNNVNSGQQTNDQFDPLQLLQDLRMGVAAQPTTVHQSFWMEEPAWQTAHPPAQSPAQSRAPGEGRPRRSQPVEEQPVEEQPQQPRLNTNNNSTGSTDIVSAIRSQNITSPVSARQRIIRVPTMANFFPIAESIPDEQANASANSFQQVPPMNTFSARLPLHSSHQCTAHRNMQPQPEEQAQVNVRHSCSSIPSYDHPPVPYQHQRSPNGALSRIFLDGSPDQQYMNTLPSQQPPSQQPQAGAEEQDQEAVNAHASKSSNVNPSRYKTEQCRPFNETGTCKYSDKCQFAHGPEDLRSVTRHPKYKTEMCNTYHTKWYCPYGSRCHYIHDETSEKLAAIEAEKQRQQMEAAAAQTEQAMRNAEHVMSVRKLEAKEALLAFIDEARRQDESGSLGLTLVEVEERRQRKLALQLEAHEQRMRLEQAERLDQGLGLTQETTLQYSSHPTLLQYPSHPSVPHDPSHPQQRQSVRIDVYGSIGSTPRDSLPSTNPESPASGRSVSTSPFSGVSFTTQGALLPSSFTYTIPNEARAWQEFRQEHPGIDRAPFSQWNHQGQTNHQGQNNMHRHQGQHNQPRNQGQQNQPRNQGQRNQHRNQAQGEYRQQQGQYRQQQGQYRQQQGQQNGRPLVSTQQAAGSNQQASGSNQQAPTTQGRWIRGAGSVNPLPPGYQF